MNQNENQTFIEEIKKNSKIFEEKISKLNSQNDSEDFSVKNKFKKYKYTKKKNLNRKEYCETENNVEENFFIEEKLHDKLKKLKRYNKNYVYDIIQINNNNYEKYENENENIIYRNTIDNHDYQKLKKVKSYLNNDYIIEELKETINQKNSYIKLLKAEIEEKNKLPSQENYNELNNKYEKILSEFNSVQNTIQLKDDKICNLKMKLDSILAQNKNMKGVLDKKENELEKMKTSIKIMREEVISAKNQMNQEMTNQKKISKDYELLNQKYNLIISERDILNKKIEEKNLENLKIKKENLQFKKLIDKLKEEIKERDTKENNSKKKLFAKQNRVDKNKFLENKDQKLIIKNSDKNIKEKLEENKISNNKQTFYNKKENKNIEIETDNDSEEEKIIYNNDDESNNELSFNKEKNKTLKNIIDRDIINKKKQEKLLSGREDTINKQINYLYDKNKEEKDIKYLTQKKCNDKIIGCDRKKIKSLIKRKDFQVIENEINILNEVKEKLKSELMKMPEKPRNLSDIRNKKEIKDEINKIEDDINFINMILKSKGYLN